MASKDFDLEFFLSQPTWDQLSEIRKADWLQIAQYYQISLPAHSSKVTKAKVKSLVLRYLVNQGLLEAVAEYVPFSDDTEEESMPEKSHTSVRPKEAEGTFRTTPKADPPPSLELEKYKLELQYRKEVEIEMRKVEKEVEMRKVEVEMRKVEMEVEMRKVEVERELKLKELEESSKHKYKELAIQEKELSVNFTAVSSMVPPFDEGDIDGSFKLFEKLATKQEWPKEEWMNIVGPKLSGKSLRVYSSLEKPEDYDFAKTQILHAHAITPEGYRQKFRNLTKAKNQTFVEFATEKLRQFKKWLEALNVTTYSELMNIMVLEEWKSKIPFPVLRYIEESNEKELIKVAEMADAHALRLESWNVLRVDHGTSVTSTSSDSQNRSSDGQKGNSATSNQPVCAYCKKTGHTIAKCRHPRCQYSKRDTKPVASNNSSPQTNMFKAFTFPGRVALSQKDQTFPITILRDTGAAQSILVQDVIPNLSHKFTGEKVLLSDLTSQMSYPLVEVYLECPLFKSNVKVAVKNGKLPVQGVQLLLGNDLAGTLIVPNIITADRPLPKVLDESPDLFPSCAVTRAQAKLSESKSPNPLPSLPSPKVQDDLINQPLSKEELIKAQNSDPSLAGLRHVAVNSSNLDTLPAFYYHNGVLMRAYRPPSLTKNDSWAETHQVVLPTSVRPSVLKLAHDGYAGHLGVRKTYNKILSHFYWPGIKNDVTQFIKTCHICQVTGKVNQPIPPAPLFSIPVVHEPFEKIIIDCVGPLPKTKKGNEYLLTVMDSATRYPEAFPLKNITAKSVLKPLLNMFTSKGIPKQIQSDQGTNFTSQTFKQVLTELGVEHVTSSAYHPQSQGCLERFHQTLKQVLRKYCLENCTGWDEGIDWLLFAYRESVQESLGVSPFELVYGRPLRGPLKILKEKWFSKPSEPTTVLKYVEDLAQKLRKVRTFAHANLSQSQEKSKKHYDLKAIPRKFAPGDKVLVFLPIPGSPLKKKYSGPYLIKKQLSPLNYIIATPDRRKSTQLVHVNLLKPYYSRSPEVDDGTVPPVALCVADISPTSETGFDPDGESILPVDLPSNQGSLSNSDILNDIDNYFFDVSPEQKADLVQLLHKFPSVTSDSPGLCNYMKHDIKLISSCQAPIRQAPYKLHPHKKKIMEKEVEYLLSHGLAEPSMSPWASPCILVPKPDDSHRLCTDYRKVNQVTLKDSYPLPLIEDLLNLIGQSKYITTIDLTKGYYQIPLTEQAKEISAFITPFGHFQYIVLAFGMTNAPSTFQRVINQVIRGLEGTAAYLDDLVVVADTWDEHLDRLQALLQSLEVAGFTINLKKCVFGHGTVNYLGHTVGKGMVRPKAANVSAILAFPTPTTRKEVMRFLGMAGYYRRFCVNFSAVAAPLTNLTSAKVSFQWSPACDKAFQHLKQFLSSQPVLRAPDFNLPFHLQIDASGLGVGAVLLQADLETSVLHPVAYYSCKLKNHQLAYSTIEKEALSLILAIKKFECYLQTSPHCVQVFTDHNPLAFINSTKLSNQRILRWSLLLQSYNLQVHHIKGTDNIFADALSRGFRDDDNST